MADDDTQRSGPILIQPDCGGQRNHLTPGRGQRFADVQDQRVLAVAQLNAVAADLVGAAVDPHLEGRWFAESLGVHPSRAHPRRSSAA